MLEVGGHYIGVDILISKSDQIARDHVVAWSHDAHENLIGRVHANLILNTRIARGKVMELTANVIEESMFA